MNGSFLLLSAAVALGADTPPPAAAPAVPAPVVAAAPITVSGTGCTGCGAPAVGWGSAPVAWGGCDPCAPRVGLFARLKARWDGRTRLFGSSACAPACAPACDPCAVAAPVVVHAPAPAPACGCGQALFTGFTTSCSDPCERVGLLARLRARFGGGRSCDAAAAPLACGSCASSVVGFPSAGCTSSFGTVLTPTTPPATTAPPDKMPAPMPMDPKKDEPKKDEPKKLSVSDVPAPMVPAVDVPRVPTLGGTSGKY